MCKRKEGSGVEPKKLVCVCCVLSFKVIMFTNGHMNGIDEDSEEDDLDFDMWAGQFEFIGQNMMNQDRFIDFNQCNGVKRPPNNQVIR